MDNEKALNKHYEAFSSQTYGETSYERMQMIIEELKPSQVCCVVFIDYMGDFICFDVVLCDGVMVRVFESLTDRAWVRIHLVLFIFVLLENCFLSSKKFLKYLENFKNIF